MPALPSPTPPRAQRGADAGRDADSLASLHTRLIAWFEANARELPWREAGTTPWGVLVSEVMSQQTPVSRVAPRWLDWMQRWPGPHELAVASTTDVLRAWDRLGYPRRALRLVACARAVVERWGGELPRTEADLRSLPGIGEYTAAAVVAFAYRGRAVVLDTNVRRVLARLLGGEALPAPSLTRAERDRAADVLPADPATSARWNIALMEDSVRSCAGRPARRARPARSGTRAPGEAPATPPTRTPGDGGRRPGTARTARCAGASWRCCARRGIVRCRSRPSSTCSWTSRMRSSTGPSPGWWPTGSPTA